MYELAALGGEARGQRRIVKQSLDRRRQRGRIRRRHQQPGFFVNYNFGRAVHFRRDHRAARRKRLDRDQRQTLVQRGQDHHVGGFEEFRHVAPVAEESHAISEPERFALRAQALIERALAGEQRDEIWPLLSKRRERIYKVGDPGAAAYVVLSGQVSVFTVDEDQQEVVVDEPGSGEFFGFASMLEMTPHQTNALALVESLCLEVTREDIEVLLTKKPMAGMDMLTVLGRQFHASQELVRLRASRNSNDVIEEEMSFGDRIADTVARFGGSWTFIILFGVVLAIYTLVNVVMRGHAWDPYPFILLNLFLSMLAAIQAPVIMMSQNRRVSAPG